MLSGTQRIRLLEQNGWELLPTQRRIIGADDKWFYGLAGGIKYGKSLSAGLFLFAESIFNPRYPERKTYWVVAEDYDKTSYVFEFLLAEFNKLYGNDWRAFAHSKPSTPKRDSWTLELTNGIIIKTKSWGNPESLHQEDVHGLVMDEFGLCDQYSWEERLLPRVLQAPDPFVFVAGTWEGAGELMKTIYEEAQVDPEMVFLCAPSWENTFRYPDGRESKEFKLLEKQLPIEVFEERFAAIPKKPSGLVYPEFSLHVHCGDFPYDPGTPVEIWVDPGTQVYAVLAVQAMGNDDFKVIDEIYEEGYSTEGIKEIVAGKPWQPDLVGGAIDDKARESQMIWQSEKVAGFGVHLRKRPVPIEAGIERVKTYLHSRIYDSEDSRIFEFKGIKGVPKIFFDRHCKYTIKEFLRYRWPKETPRAGLPRVPIKKHDHAMNDVAYGLVDAVGFVPRNRPAPMRRPDKYAHI